MRCRTYDMSELLSTRDLNSIIVVELGVRLLRVDPREMRRSVCALPDEKRRFYCRNLVMMSFGNGRWTTSTGQADVSAGQRCTHAEKICQDKI